MYLVPTWQVRVTVGDSSLSCCPCVTSFERQLTPSCIDSAFKSVCILPAYIFFLSAFYLACLRLLSAFHWIASSLCIVPFTSSLCLQFVYSSLLSAYFLRHLHFVHVFSLFTFFPPPFYFPPHHVYIQLPLCLHSFSFSLFMFLFLLVCIAHPHLHSSFSSLYNLLLPPFYIPPHYLHSSCC